MSESETNEAVGKEGQKPENATRKRVRHRKKLLYENILKQMEFYFSDANLAKDRFLGQILKEEDSVPVELFLKFNKIRSLTNDANAIAKAVGRSEFLELVADGTKIKRKTPVVEYDADSRTVYVESIPASATREWLQRVFAQYGPVAYISLPRFKDSQRIKGYGFVEFKNPEDAQKCVGVFTKMGCKLPTGMPPEELTSIKTFSMEDPPDEQREAKEEYEPPKKKTKKAKDKKPTKDVKNEVQKEVLLEEDNNPLKDNISIRTSEVESKGETTSQDEGTKSDTEGSRKKKRRKRSAKDRSLRRSERESPTLWGLQVLAKREWKLLRNRYLNLQRQRAKEMRRAAHAARPELEEAGAPGDADAARQLPAAAQAVSNAMRQADEPARLDSSRVPISRPTHVRFDDDDR